MALFLVWRRRFVRRTSDGPSPRSRSMTEHTRMIVVPCRARRRRSSVQAADGLAVPPVRSGGALTVGDALPLAAEGYRSTAVGSHRPVDAVEKFGAITGADLPNEPLVTCRNLRPVRDCEPLRYRR